MKHLATFLLAALLLGAAACKTSRRAAGAALKPKSEKVLMKHLSENQVSADWLEAKARVSYADEYGGESFSATIRIKRDSAIWMVFKKFSLEGARALIRPDSFFVIDRLNREYTAKPFSYLQKEYNLPVNFQGLQAILLGNPVFFSTQTEAGVDSSRYLLSQKTDNLTAKYWLDGTDMRLAEFLVDDFRNSRSLSVVSTDYRPLDDKQKFSYFRSFNLNGGGLGSAHVGVEFSKVEINVPQKMDFQIPDRYERAD